MKRKISLTIVLPAFNEQGNIEKAIEQAASYASDFKDYEIIVVNDGSTDKTEEIVSQIKIPKVRLINFEQNQGYGAAVWEGLKSARSDLVFFTDSDNQFNIKELDKLLVYINDYDVVVGFRADRKDPIHRKLNMRLWNFAVNLLLNINLKDVDCAFKLFKKEVIKDMKIKSKGATFSPELMSEIYEKGYNVKEVAVSHFPRKSGSPTGANMAVVIRALKELIILKVRK